MTCVIPVATGIRMERRIPDVVWDASIPDELRHGFPTVPAENRAITERELTHREPPVLRTRK